MAEVFAIALEDSLHPKNGSMKDPGELQHWIQRGDTR